jgi:toluene monooxygenase system ferredoxin subunit
MAFTRVMAEGELWLGELRACVVEGTKVLLLRVEDGVHAYEDRCAHLGVPLSEGRLEGTTLTCSAHHYSYDACSGQGVNPKNLCLRAYPVKLEGGDIFVDVAAPAGSVRR